MTITQDDDLNNTVLSVLDTNRQRAFARAVHKANQDFTEFAVTQSDVFKDMESGDLTRFLRGFLMARIKSEFGEDSTIRNENGIFCVVFDDLVLIHFKKLGNDHLGSIPKTLEKAKRLPQQNPLPGFDDEEIPLSQLDYVIGGYIKDEAGTIGEFYFNVQDGQLLLAQKELDFSNLELSPSIEREVPTSNTTFTRKGSKNSSPQEAS